MSIYPLEKTKIDPAFVSHLATIANNPQLTPQVSYSVACIAQVILPTNAHRLHYLPSIQNHKLQLIKLAASSKAMSQQNLLNLLRIINCLDGLSAQQGVIVIQTINSVSVSKGDFLGQLCEEIKIFSTKVDSICQHDQYLLRGLSGKMNGQQFLSFLESMSSQQLFQISSNDLIEIARQYQNEPKVLRILLQAVHWWSLNHTLQQDIVQKVANFIADLVNIYSQRQTDLITLCGLIYQQLVNFNRNEPLLPKGINLFLKEWVQVPIPRAYLPGKHIIIQNFSQVAAIIEAKSDISVNKQFHYLLNHYACTRFPWASQLQAYNTSKMLEKEFILRITELTEPQHQRKTLIAQKQQINFAAWLPVACFRSVEGLMKKLEMSNASEAVQSIPIIQRLNRQHPKYQELLIMMVQKSVEYRQFQSLKQIERMVKSEIDPKTVISKLKQKASVHIKDSNAKSKRYFALVPLLLGKTEIQLEVADQLGTIFGFETISMRLKLYVAQFLVRKMVQKPLEKFIAVLVRALESQQAGEVLKALVWSLKNLEDLNKATLDWVSSRFSDSGQRLLQIIFSMLMGNAATSAAKILFKLQKFGVYGQSWQPVYRWVMLALEKSHHQLLTLDCLQIFQMLLEKVGQGVPKPVADKFQKVVASKWNKLTHEHYFTIERIVELLNQSTMMNFRKQPIYNLSDLLREQQQLQNNFKKDQLDSISRYLHALSWNVVFQQTDSSTTVKNILSLFKLISKKNDPGQPSRFVSALQTLLYLYADEESIVEPEVDEFVAGIITSASSEIVSKCGHWWQVWTLCIEFLSRVPHSINLLKIPFSTLLKLGFNEPKWIANITELVEIVLESKPKAVSNFKLQEVLKPIQIRIISLQGPLLQDYLDFIDALFSVEGDYQTFLGKNLKLLQRILVAQGQNVGYRSSLVSYVLQTILEYEYDLQKETVWCLFNKYACDSSIVLSLLQYLEGKETDSNGSIDKQLLMRLVLTHTQDQEIQDKCRALFNTHVPTSSADRQFMNYFTQGNYLKCQEMLPNIINPFALQLSLPEIRSFLQWKQTGSSAKKMLRFLRDHPEAYLKMHACQALYLNQDYSSLLCETLKTLKEEPIYQKFVASGNKGHITVQSLSVSKIIYDTVASMMRSKAISHELKSYLINVFRSNEDVAGSISELFTIVLSKHIQGQSVQNIQLLYTFCRQVVGQWQLISPDRVNRYNLRQLIYIFPYSLSDLTPSILPIDGLLNHYLSLMQNFRVIKGQIGSDRYVERVIKAMLDRLNSDQRDSFIDNYLRIHSTLENKNQMILQKSKQNQINRLMVLLSRALEATNNLLQAQMVDSQAKLPLQSVAGYVMAVLHSLSMGLELDPPTIERLSLLNQSIDSYGFHEESKNAIKEALKHLLKRAGIYQPKLAEKKGQKLQMINTEESVQNLPSNPMSRSKNIQTPFSNQDYGLLGLYASMRPSENVEKDEGQLKKEAQQSYFRYKQTEQRVTIKEHVVETNTTILILNEQPPSKIEQQLQVTAQHNVPHETKASPSQEERKENLQNAQKIKSGEYSIQSLKDHCKFIASLADLPIISTHEFSQLLISLDAVTQTVHSHAFYVKKVADTQTVFKLIQIYKNLLRVGPKDSQAVAVGSLKLCVAMAQMKEKKMKLFADEESIRFFKLLVKKTMNQKRSGEEIPLLLSVLYACKSNTQAYFKEGLFSMIVEMVNRELSADQVIDYLIRIDLSAQLINQIYQRGLFNKLMAVVSTQPKNPQERTIINLWVKLAGKVCINNAIQERFRSKQLHVKVWQLFKSDSNLAERLNLCYFYAYLCIKNDAICDWLMQNRVLQDLLAYLITATHNDQLYLLFYHFCFGNTTSRDYCFRIKYHLHLIERLGLSQSHLSKHFYKSLGQMMTSRLHVPVFFKEEVVSKLVDNYQGKPEPAVYECLLDFISTLETESEFDELKRQHFWDSLKIFEYKISNEATYSYLLQTFLIMIKKGRIKEFNQPEIRSKVCLKAQYSINMQGKQLALRFILALSVKNKENYLTQRCIKLLASVMGLKVSANQLQLALDLLNLQGTTKKTTFLNYFTVHGIHTLIIDSLPTLTAENMLIALQIISILCLNSQNNEAICKKGLASLIKSLDKNNSRQTVLSGMKLLKIFSQAKNCTKQFQEARIADYIKSSSLLGTVKTNMLHQEFNELVSSLIHNNILTADESKDIIRTAQQSGIKVDMSNLTKSSEGQANQDRVDQAARYLRQGRKVRMYKTDGSVSQLFLFISSDLLELNCGLKMTEVVKQKWRLPINEITKIITYQGQDSPDFLASVFQKNSGFFSKTPGFQCCLVLEGKNNSFYICFSSQAERQQWINEFKVIQQNVQTILSKLR